MSNTLEIVLHSSGLDNDGQLQIREAMHPFWLQALDWQSKVAEVTDPKIARASRLTLKKIRVEAEHKKAELKESILVRGRAIDAAFRAIESTILPLEERLDVIEKAEARRLEAEAKARAEARVAELAALEFTAIGVDLAKLPDDQYTALLGQAQSQLAQRQDAARVKAEAEAQIAAERRLREDAENKAKAEAWAKYEAERKAQAEVNAKLRAELEAKVAAEQKAREEAEARAAAEAAARAAVEQKAAAEAAARAAIEQKAREQAEAEARAAAEAAARAAREAAEAAAKAEAERVRLAAQPDVVRLLISARSMQEGVKSAFVEREMITPKGASLCASARLRVTNLLNSIVSELEAAR